MANGLAERVNQRAQVAHPDSNGAAAKAPATLADQIRGMQEQFALAMPRGAEAQQLVRDALSLVRTTKHLAECDAQSVLGGLMTFAQLGLRPGVLGHGWLIPFKKRYKDGKIWRDRYEAQIVIGYKGYLELVHRSQNIETIVGRAVHANDIFDIEYGLEDRLVHKPAMKGDRGPVAGYYAIIKYKGGGYVMWHMTRDEALEWRAKFSMAAYTDRETGAFKGSGPWFEETGPAGGTGFDQMAIKTCFLRAARWAPKGTDITLGRAMEVDGAVRFDVDPTNVDAMLEAEHPAHAAIEAEVVKPEPEPEPRDEPAPAPTPDDAAAVDKFWGEQPSS